MRQIAVEAPTVSVVPPVQPNPLQRWRNDTSPQTGLLIAFPRPKCSMTERSLARTANRLLIKQHVP